MPTLSSLLRAGMTLKHASIFEELSHSPRHPNDLALELGETPKSIEEKMKELQPFLQAHGSVIQQKHGCWVLERKTACVNFPNP